ncbi:hydroxyisourate hydrolase [Jannaschia sp. M317]|uniref:hydroxyisourate hydrolase n=1 Tax=Jannaschia sp. M317 TaxID=2867011 RepID=UPI0021A799FA|nr:hydroxyisourate hydrolase [Jannaschia sp. M317]UWQ17961.1 hydroxyisourate hydrolase [Jannaschia sp. M317]
MAGYLTTHVLDTARGRPAAGLAVTLVRLTPEGRETIAEAMTNADGRTDAPILGQDAFEPGNYELIFHAGPWLRAEGLVDGEILFLDDIPLRFGLSEDMHYHVPLLLSPYAYSTYRGS